MHKYTMYQTFFLLLFSARTIYKKEDFYQIKRICRYVAKHVIFQMNTYDFACSRSQLLCSGLIISHGFHYFSFFKNHFRFCFCFGNCIIPYLLSCWFVKLRRILHWFSFGDSPPSTKIEAYEKHCSFEKSDQIRKGRGLSFKQIWGPFTQGCFVPSFGWNWHSGSGEGDENVEY